MPVRKITLGDRRAQDVRFNELKERLIKEWRESPEQSASNAPIIVEENDRKGRLIHVYVAWDEWADLDVETRSEMIVDALQEVKGQDAVMELAIAMGLTQAEFKRIFP